MIWKNLSRRERFLKFSESQQESPSRSVNGQGSLSSGKQGISPMIMTRRLNEVQKALAACRGAFGIIMLFGLAINLLTLSSPLYMMQVFDHVLSSRSGDTLMMLTLITAFAIAVLCLLEALRGQVMVRVGNWLDDRLGPCVFGSALRTALTRDATQSAQSLRDLGAVRGFLSGPSMPPLMDLPWSPIFILALFTLHPVLGLIGVGGGAALFVLAVLNEFVTKAPLARA